MQLNGFYKFFLQEPNSIETISCIQFKRLFVEYRVAAANDGDSPVTSVKFRDVTMQLTPIAGDREVT
jgi:hypothetical protein